MSLIITYIGSKGCVIVGDKRRIGFYGPEQARERLEEELYSGKINTSEKLFKKADEHGITIKISDDAEKIRERDDVVIGEVRSKTTLETKRKRIYATTGTYSMIELLGSDVQTMKSGESAIIVFGNKYTQKLAEKSVNKFWKSKINLLEVGKIFETVMEQVALETPSVSPEHDMIIKYPKIGLKSAKELVRKTIIQDVKELSMWRDKLRENMVTTSKNIQMASKIIITGDIGTVDYVKDNEIGIILNKGIEALNKDWEVMVKPSEIIRMTIEDISNVSKGDLAVIENENLCIKRTKELLNCEFILCKSE
ncbi:DUF2121 domain-containing protein [Methanobacterium sp.]|uniref:MJ0548 connectase family domain-containing protein n=1 Tax=Methanobacterium sp. TaxID=2164 RepID=UPI003C74F497